MARRLNYRHWFRVAAGLLAAALVLLLTATIGTIFYDHFVQHFYCKAAPCARAPRSRDWAILVALLLGWVACVGVLYWLARLPPRHRVRAQSRNVDADVLILPVSRPFRRRTVTAAEHARDAAQLRALEKFLLGKDGTLLFGARAVAPAAWTSADLCDPEARLQGAVPGTLPLDELAWQQSWRAVRDWVGAAARLHRILILPSNETGEYAECFQTCLEQVVKREAGTAVPPACVLEPATKFELIEPLVAGLRALVERERPKRDDGKPKPGWKCRVDITGGSRVFAAAAVIAAADDDVFFSYVADASPYQIEMYDVVVEDRRVELAT